MIEFVLIIFFIVAIASSLTVVLQNQSLGTLDGDAQLIKSVLIDAQLRAINSIQGTAWGVRFDNTVSSSPTYSIFSGTSFVAASTTHYVSKNVQFCFPQSGTTYDFPFNKNTGKLASIKSVVIELRSDTAHSNQKIVQASTQGVLTITDAVNTDCTPGGH